MHTIDSNRPGNLKKILAGSVACGLFALLMPVTAMAGGPKYGPWSQDKPVPRVGGFVAGGCPIESRDGLAIYTARRSPIGDDDVVDDLNIWVNMRDSKNDPFGPAEPLPEVINKPDSNEFCPTPLGAGKFLFVSSRADLGCSMGGGDSDIYKSRLHPAKGWKEPKNLGCVIDGTGPNTLGSEFSPGILNRLGKKFLYFSSTGTGNHDLFVAKRKRNGRYGEGQPIEELNTEADDRMPTLSKNGLEIVFSSNRRGEGGQDIYYSSRKNHRAPWAPPINLSVELGLSTADADETRASFSWDGRRVNYGSGGQVYFIEREKLRGRN